MAPRRRRRPGRARSANPDANRQTAGAHHSDSVASGPAQQIGNAVKPRFASARTERAVRCAEPRLNYQALSQTTAQPQVSSFRSCDALLNERNHGSIESGFDFAAMKGVLALTTLSLLACPRQDELAFCECAETDPHQTQLLRAARSPAGSVWLEGRTADAWWVLEGKVQEDAGVALLPNRSGRGVSATWVNSERTLRVSIDTVPCLFGDQQCYAHPPDGGLSSATDTIACRCP